MAELEDTLVTLYLLHRYQTEAAAKLIGGLNYRYAVRGDEGMVTEAIPRAEQLKALEVVLQTLKPENLTLSESLLRILPPRPPGFPRTRESFGAHTGLTFDPEGAVEAAAGITAALLFDPARASRLVEYHARDRRQLGLEEMISAVLTATWQSSRLTGLAGETQFSIEDTVLRHLLGLAASTEASGQAKAIALASVMKLEQWLKGREASESEEASAHRAAAVEQIERFRKEPEKFASAPELPIPPGQPIGDPDGW